MANRFEGAFRSFDQAELFYQLWSVDQPKGTIIVTHGLAEHSECYHPFAKTLQADGWEIFGWDLRGHGRSEGKRGYVRDFSDYCKDLRAFVELIIKERQAKTTPLYLFGHSMGGLISTLTTMDWPSPPVQGLLLSSPAFGIAVQVPVLKDKVARLAHKFLPTLTLYNELNYNDLSRDEAMVKSYGQDVLRHDKISPAVYLGMVDGGKRVADSPSSITLPVLLQVAGVDRIVSAPIAQEIFPKLPNKRNQMHYYPDSRHEIYNDLDRNQAFADLRKFISQS